MPHTRNAKDCHAQIFRFLHFHEKLDELDELI